MRLSVYERIMQGLLEAIAFARGEGEAVVHVVSDEGLSPSDSVNTIKARP